MIGLENDFQFSTSESSHTIHTTVERTILILLKQVKSFHNAVDSAKTNSFDI